MKNEIDNSDNTKEDKNDFILKENLNFYENKHIPCNQYEKKLEIKGDKGNLNNETNPFLKAQKLINNCNIDIDINKIKNIEESDDEKEIEDRKNKEYKELLLDSKFIEKEELVGDLTKKTKNFCYKYNIYGNKKFYLMSNYKNLDKYEKLYYYCINHRTTKFSGKFTDKGYKKNFNM